MNHKYKEVINMDKDKEKEVLNDLAIFKMSFNDLMRLIEDSDNAEFLAEILDEMKEISIMINKLTLRKSQEFDKVINEEMNILKKDS